MPKCTGFALSLVIALWASRALAQGTASPAAASAPSAGSRPEGLVKNVQIQGGRGIAITSECFYQFSLEKPAEWTSKISIHGVGAVRVLGASGNGDLLIAGQKAGRGGLLKPALYRWHEGAADLQFVSDLASEAYAFSDAGIGLCGEGGNLNISENAGAADSWGSWTPTGLGGSQNQIEEAVWIAGTDFAFTDGGHHLSLARIDRGTERILWQVKNASSSRPLAATSQGVWTVGIGQTSQWIDEHRLTDGAVVATIQTPMVLNQLILTSNFMVAAGDNPNPVNPPIDWFVIPLADQQAPIKKQSGRSLFRGAVESSKKELFLFFADGSFIRGDVPDAKLQMVQADNLQLHKSLKEKSDALSPTPEQLAEYQKLLPRVQGMDRTNLLQKSTQQPGTFREQMEWMLIQLRNMPEPTNQ